MKNRQFISYSHWSARVIIITIIYLLSSTLIIYNFKNQDFSSITEYIMITFAVMVSVLALAFTPLYLSLENGHIRVKKIIGSINIPLTEVQSISQVTKKELRNSLRLFGSRGVFGYIGKFRNKKFGNYNMYATERNNLILIKTDSGYYVFNCKDATQLITLADNARSSVI